MRLADIHDFDRPVQITWLGVAPTEPHYDHGSEVRYTVRYAMHFSLCHLRFPC